MQLLVNGQSVPFTAVRAMIASHYWSNDLDGWIDIDTDVAPAMFLSMRDSTAFRNSECAPLAWGVELDGETMSSWETADAIRGYVDVWERLDNKPQRHRLFGEVRFVRICNSD